MVSNNLVRSKLYLLEGKVGSEKCESKRCSACLNVFETDNFKEQYKINHQLNCKDKCLIYLLSCTVCGLHYVGSNTDRFRIRLNDYKENNRKTKIAVLLLLTKQVRLIPLEERNTGEEF